MNTVIINWLSGDNQRKFDLMLDVRSGIVVWRMRETVAFATGAAR